MTTTDYTPDDLVLCQSADGWSFHAPGSTDEAIAEGDAPYILTGPGQVRESDRLAAYQRWADESEDETDGAEDADEKDIRITR